MIEIILAGACFYVVLIMLLETCTDVLPKASVWVGDNITWQIRALVATRKYGKRVRILKFEETGSVINGKFRTDVLDIFGAWRVYMEEGWLSVSGYRLKRVHWKLAFED